MKKWTILRIYFLVYIACCITYTIAKWKILSYEEGWGVVAMVGLIGFGLFGLLIDLILTLIIKDKKVLNGIGILIVIGFSIMLLIELKQ
ncbi:hypothetical protein QVZ41_14000 [Wenyingzhuangia sp. chi5]|uniref:Uncharacterized protein n=1 Tax=Wenyingzhuangia gilva TaxID=3057677 RepID=A0ABT8VVE8_9FLAO|nr:hypothetical protein [Wenyingzhuangia sp. chi5]MDO3695960.1 hypothetical protein [Wenyingzhuangia sp. chi5]